MGQQPTAPGGYFEFRSVQHQENVQAQLKARISCWRIQGKYREDFDPSWLSWSWLINSFWFSFRQSSENSNFPSMLWAQPHPLKHIVDSWFRMFLHLFLCFRFRYIFVQPFLSGILPYPYLVLFSFIELLTYHIFTTSLSGFILFMFYSCWRILFIWWPTVLKAKYEVIWSALYREAKRTIELSAV